MSRYFALQTWVGSHDNEPDYNGNQCGSRNVRSMPVIPLYDRFGNANVSAFSDEAIQSRKAKPKKEIPIQYKITPAQRTITRLESIREELESKFEDGQLEFSEYVELSHALDIKFERAWKNLDRQLGRVNKPVSSGTRTEQENASTGLFDTFHAVFKVGSEAVCKNTAKKPENNFIEDAKMFLLFSLIGASILLIASH